MNYRQGRSESGRGRSISVEEPIQAPIRGNERREARVIFAADCRRSRDGRGTDPRGHREDSEGNEAVDGRVEILWLLCEHGHDRVVFAFHGIA
jgi:hypothetical protein